MDTKPTDLNNKIHIDRMETQIQNLRKENQEQKEQLETCQGKGSRYQSKVNTIGAKNELLSKTTDKKLTDMNAKINGIQFMLQTFMRKVDNLSHN